MVEERTNLDYGRDDLPGGETDALRADDYLTADRVAAIEHPDDVVAPVQEDELLVDEENSEASTYGAP